jgi:integrase
MPLNLGEATTSGEGGPEPDVMTLVPIWRRVAQPRAEKSIQRMRHSAKLFIEAVGHISPQEVTRQDVMRFRDRVEGMGLSHRSATQYLELVHRLFGVALSEGLVDHNPAAGIKIRKIAGRFADSQRRRPFEPDHIRALFDAAANESEEFRWIIRILAYHGMRSGEVTQLRVEDVTDLFGVPVLRVHDRFGSIKNRFSQRDVPLHPHCQDLLAYARRVEGPWLFDRARWRADRFQRYASAFLRAKAGLSDRTLTMHSLRHTWRTLAREIGMPVTVSRAIMGHAMGRDVHEAYGGGPSLRLMADWMARIDPLAGDVGSAAQNGHRE